MIEINKIYCEDCMQTMSRMPDDFVDIIFTSPPYNKAGYEGFIRKYYKHDIIGKRLRNISYGNDSLNDFMPENKYQEWQIKVLNECWRVLKKDGMMFYNHKVRIAKHKASHPMEWILKSSMIFRQQIIWQRNGSPSVGRHRFLPTTELVFWLTKEAKQPLFYRLNNDSELIRLNHSLDKEHPCSHPVNLIVKILRHCSGKIVYDPFMGSGTTAVASIKLNKDWIGSETVPEYCDLTEKRTKIEQSILKLALN